MSQGENALINSINQFRNDPMGYLLGGGQGTSTYSPDDLMSYLGQANQLFRATGQQGNFMDFIWVGLQRARVALSQDIAQEATMPLKDLQHQQHQGVLLDLLGLHSQDKII
eukprot:UN03962